MLSLRACPFLSVALLPRLIRQSLPQTRQSSMNLGCDYRLEYVASERGGHRWHQNTELSIAKDGSFNSNSLPASGSSCLLLTHSSPDWNHHVLVLGNSAKKVTFQVRFSFLAAFCDLRGHFLTISCFAAAGEEHQEDPYLLHQGRQGYYQFVDSHDKYLHSTGTGAASWAFHQITLTPAEKSS